MIKRQVEGLGDRAAVLVVAVPLPCLVTKVWWSFSKPRALGSPYVPQSLHKGASSWMDFDVGGLGKYCLITYRAMSIYCEFECESNLLFKKKRGRRRYIQIYK